MVPPHVPARRVGGVPPTEGNDSPQPAMLYVWYHHPRSGCVTSIAVDPSELSRSGRYPLSKGGLVTPSSRARNCSRKIVRIDSPIVGLLIAGVWVQISRVKFLTVVSSTMAVPDPAPGVVGFPLPNSVQLFLSPTACTW